MHETIKAGGFTECIVYLQVTRGAPASMRSRKTCSAS